MNRIDAVFRRFPQYAYDSDNTNSSIYKLIKAIVDEVDITMQNIDRIDKMIGIDTVLPDDIYNRFGALLNIKQNPGETDEQYRHRLKVSITSLVGGTKEAIKFAIASGMGITNDSEAMDRIQVYDAWEYPNEATNMVREYGHVICDIDLNNGKYSIDMENTVTESVNNAKAAGVAVNFVYRNFRIIYYIELDDITYASLDTLFYNGVGE